MGKRTLLTGMLTLLAVVATSFAIAGCGGKSSSEKGGSTSTSTTTTGPHKKASKAPAY